MILPLPTIDFKMLSILMVTSTTATPYKSKNVVLFNLTIKIASL